VRSGDHVFVGSACATPRTLVRTLEDIETPISGIQFVHFLTDGVVPDRGHGARTRFQHTTFYVGRDTQEFVATDKVDYVPISISQVHRLIETGRIPIDVALVQLSPPDEEGMCSFGVSVALAPVAARKASTVIAEVNPNMPRTMGDSTIHINDIDHLVEVETPIIEYVHEPADEVGQQIARYVARIIDDGATLQIGLGRIPNEMLKYLTNRRDLGIHSDVVTEPVVDLIQQGVITGARKTLHPHKVVSSYCMGTRRLYELIDGNPTFSFHPIDYTCNPETIAANAKMVSVTQAFSMDLSGQICADQYRGEFYGGVSSLRRSIQPARLHSGRSRRRRREGHNLPRLHK
jgi:acyl-CoA hydrolase